MNEIIIVINGNKWEIKAASNKIDENILDIYIEKNSDRLRKKYLDFVEGLAKKKIGEKALCDYFKISKGYNIWWMSLIVEKSVFKSPCIVSCIKLLALEEIINIHKIDKLTVKGSDKNIINSIRELTANLGIRFKTERKLNLFNIKDYLNPRELYNSAPQILRAYLFFLRQFFSKWVWINLLYRPLKSTNSIMIFSYFIHLDLDKLKEGNFYSNHWGPLPELLNQNKVVSNWFHHFLRSDSAGSVKEGLKHIRKFNNVDQSHIFINNFLRFGMLFKILKDFIQLSNKFLGKAYMLKNFRVKDSCVNLWSILENDWTSSLKGITLMQNLIWIYQLDKAFSELPFQRVGIYLFENQGWERAMIHAWRRNNHGMLLGVQHSVIRFWDMRYFDGYMKKFANKDSDIPKPDAIILNGPFALESYLKAGYDKKFFLQAEALRYISENKKSVSFTEDSKTSIKILILGDINAGATKALLMLLEKLKVKGLKFTIKFHPGTIIDLNDYPSLNINEVKLPLNKILSQFNTCIAIGSTTAGLNAYLSGLRVSVFLVEGELNLSPLKDIPGINFLHNLADLNSFICGNREPLPEKSEDSLLYFWQDSVLSKWNKLVKKIILD